MGITRKEMAMGKIKKMIKSLLYKTRSPKLKTRFLVQKMMKIQIGARKGILGEYALKDRVLAPCNSFFQEFWAFDTLDLQQDLTLERQRSILVSQTLWRRSVWFRDSLFVHEYPFRSMHPLCGSIFMLSTKEDSCL